MGNDNNGVNISIKKKQVVALFAIVTIVLLAVVIIIGIHATSLMDNPEARPREIKTWVWVLVLLLFVVVVSAAFSIVALISKSTKSSYDKEYVEKIEEKNAKLEYMVETLEESSKAKTSFLLNMSHDFRTPMNSIVGFTDMANKNIEDKEKVLDGLSKIKDSTKQMITLVNNIFDMSRVDSGKWDITLAPHNIKTEIENRLSVFEDMAKKADKFYNVNISIKDEVVLIDMHNFKRIISNVISNAIKFTRRGGEINVTLEQLNGSEEGFAKYKFTCQDNGIGIDKDYLQKIFEPFSKEKNDRYSNVEGAGLGMAITKQLVDMMGGSINIKSEEGKGTVVYIILDFEIASEDEKDFINPIKTGELVDIIAPVENKIYGKKILVVDDNELNREIAKEILESFGAIIELAEDGTYALDKLKGASKDSYDLVLMDVQMPILNGYDATKQIRALDNDIKGIPIIALSANAFKEDIENSLKAGMNGHIAKPIDAIKLCNEISKFF